MMGGWSAVLNTHPSLSHCVVQWSNRHTLVVSVVNIGLVANFHNIVCKLIVWHSRMTIARTKEPQ